MLHSTLIYPFPSCKFISHTRCICLACSGDEILRSILNLTQVKFSQFSLPPFYLQVFFFCKFSGCTFLGCPVLGLTSRPPIFSLLFVYFFFFFGQFLLLLLPSNYDLLERCCLYFFLDRCIVLNHVCPLSLLTFLLSSYRPRNTPFLCLHINKPLM